MFDINFKAKQNQGPAKLFLFSLLVSSLFLGQSLSLLAMEPREKEESHKQAIPHRHNGKVEARLQGEAREETRRGAETRVEERVEEVKFDELPKLLQNLLANKARFAREQFDNIGTSIYNQGNLEEGRTWRNLQDLTEDEAKNFCKELEKSEGDFIPADVFYTQMIKHFGKETKGKKEES